MQSFDFEHRTRFVFGPSTCDQLGHLASQLGGKCVFMVSDPGVVAAGHFERGKKSMEEAGLKVHSFHDLHENPSTDDVQKGLEFARSIQPDLIVGLGGGSSMDCAKGVNFLYSCGGKIQDYWGVGKATGPMLPMIAVPTTAGTGSEAQSFALISDAQTHVKMACGDPRAACRIAILDPELTLTKPARITALTGVDALSHALETFVTTKRTPLSLCYSREAWRRIARGLPAVLDNPLSLEARADMQLGACFAGLAIETSMLGAVHATANPLTATYGITHGQAVGLMLAPVIRFNGVAMAREYAELWRDVPGAANYADPVEATHALADFVRNLVLRAGLEVQLSNCGVNSDSLPTLASDATRQWTGTFNPRSLSETDLLELYQQAW